MPELPEMKAHAERLTQSHGGATIDKFEVISFAVLKTFSPNPRDAHGNVLKDVTTRGKVLLLNAESVSFGVHLMSGGRLKPDSKFTRRPRGGLARWHFEDHDALLLTEAGSQRKAGVWVFPSGFETNGDGAVEPFTKLGPDADTVTLDEFATMCCGAGSRRLHGFLRDQRQLAGLGRRLANEICWEAHVSPFAGVGKLESATVKVVHQAMLASIAESLVDERARKEMVKAADRICRVHRRQGEPCERCGDVIRAVEYKAYVVNYCATCQTNGKVLADNTTSKFLK